MNSPLAKLRAYAELGRISNLPTTFTNVMVGAAIGAGGAEILATPRWKHIIPAWLAIACFYIAGMAMNDLIDARIDAQERPHRPIPSGRVSHRAAMIFIVALFMIGLAVLSQINRAALGAGAALVGVILLYNLIHARWPASVLLLGVARAGVYAVGAATIAPDLNWEHFEIFAIAIGLYTAGFSLIARREMQPRHRPLRAVAVLLVLIVYLPLPFMMPAVFMFALLLLACTGYAAWEYITSPSKTKNAVMLWIASICIIDAMYLMALNQPPLAFAAAACFLLTLLAQRRLSGT